MGSNGHRSWNAENVALWLGNDEGLYRLAMECIAETRNLKLATRRLVRFLPERTPDFARYNATCVREALEGLKE